MKTTVTLDDDAYEAARDYARETGKALGRVLSEAIRQVLPPSGRKERRPLKAPSRFPTFEVPAGTPMIAASRIQQALDEDGIV